jgi:hypothetical protein
MASSLKRLAKQSLAGAKKRVPLHPLTPEQATEVIFTVLNASPAPLLRAAANSKAGKALPRNVNPQTFASIIHSILNLKRGSVYAATVTAIDADEVFHSDRFAVSLKRLGVMDEIAASLSANGFDAIASLVQNKAPFWWAEMSAMELETVRKEMSGSFTRILRRFSEDLNEEEVDSLIEATVFSLPASILPGKLQFMYGAAQATLGANQSQYTGMVRRIATNPNITLLNPNSSLDATFESYHQHLMTNISALQKLMPKASFAGSSLSTSQLQRIFRDPQFIRQLKKAFIASHQRSTHSVNLDKLYRAMRQYNVGSELQRASKMRANVTLSEDAVSAITSSIVGLFSAFAGDTKGQSLPFISAIKG